jgi:hypothetical protein
MIRYSHGNRWLEQHYSEGADTPYHKDQYSNLAVVETDAGGASAAIQGVGGVGYHRRAVPTEMAAFPTIRSTQMQIAMLALLSSSHASPPLPLM